MEDWIKYRDYAQSLEKKLTTARAERDAITRHGMRLEAERDRLREALELAVKHLEGKAEKFSEREVPPVLFQLREALSSPTPEPVTVEVMKRDLAFMLSEYLTVRESDTIAKRLLTHYDIRRKK